MINPISFKANFLRPATIKRADNSNVSASFVELDSESNRDLRAIKETNWKWDNSRSFAYEISSEFEDSCYFISPKRFFALTSQSDNFETLDSGKILGLAEVLGEGPGNVKLKFLQVDPKNNMHSKLREFKKIGSAILTAIKNIYPENSIILESVESAIPFYKSNGFEEVSKCGILLFKR